MTGTKDDEELIAGICNLDADELYNAGLGYYEAGDYDASIEYFSALICRFPDNAKALNARALALEGLGEIEAAKGDFQKAIESDPRYFRPYCGLAELNYRAHNYNASINLIDKAISLKPQYAPAYICRARVLLKLGDVAGAIKDSLEAKRLGGDLTGELADLI